MFYFSYTLLVGSLLLHLGSFVALRQGGAAICRCERVENPYIKKCTLCIVAPEALGHNIEASPILSSRLVVLGCKCSSSRAVRLAQYPHLDILQICCNVAYFIMSYCWKSSQKSKSQKKLISPGSFLSFNATIQFLVTTISFSSLLCLGAHAQARYTVVCLCVCLSV